jgi:hypothetical protein
LVQIGLDSFEVVKMLSHRQHFKKLDRGVKKTQKNLFKGATEKTIRLATILNEDSATCDWFGEYFKRGERKNWLESYCHIKVQGTGPRRELVLTKDSAIPSNLDQYYVLGDLNSINEKLLGIIPIVSPQVVESIIPSGVVPCNTTDFTTFANSIDAESCSNNNNSNISSSSSDNSNSNSCNSSSNSITIDNIDSGNTFTGNNNQLEIEEIVSYGRWEEYEMLYAHLTRILNDTNHKSIEVTLKVEVRVNMELERTALHAILCTGYIPHDDKPHFSIADRDHKCCSACFREIADNKSSIKQVYLMLLIFQVLLLLPVSPSYTTLSLFPVLII